MMPPCATGLLAVTWRPVVLRRSAPRIRRAMILDRSRFATASTPSVTALAEDGS
jgi:hypothetical protein